MVASVGLHRDSPAKPVGDPVRMPVNAGPQPGHRHLGHCGAGSPAGAGVQEFMQCVPAPSCSDFFFPFSILTLPGE